MVKRGASQNDNGSLLKKKKFGNTFVTGSGKKVGNRSMSSDPVM